MKLYLRNSSAYFGGIRSISAISIRVKWDTPTLLIGFVELGLDLGADAADLHLLLLSFLSASVPSPLPLKFHLVHVLPCRGPINHNARRLAGIQMLWIFLRLHLCRCWRVGKSQTGQKSQKWRGVLVRAYRILLARLAYAEYWRWIINAIKALLSLKGILLRFLAHMRGCLEHQALR